MEFLFSLKLIITQMFFKNMILHDWFMTLKYFIFTNYRMVKYSFSVQSHILNYLYGCKLIIRYKYC